MPSLGPSRDEEITYEMVISLFLLFAPFCWPSVALSSDSDVPAEAAGMGDIDTVAGWTLLVIFTRVGDNRDL
jgi:hypothetical protein